MENKRIELAARRAEIAENTFVFEASTVGNPDRSGDVIMPGAFSRAVLSRAVEEGWADVSHGWEGQPIGMFDAIRMEGDTLVMSGKFHSTPRAQEMRTIMLERAEAGKKTSVSIGFMPDYDKARSFESGQALLDWAASEGYDLNLLDQKAIKKLGWCRAIPSVSELFECSVCNVGMNPRAKVRETKTLSGEEGLGLTLAEHLDLAHGAMTRASEALRLRIAEGKDLSPDRWAQVEALKAAADELLQARPVSSATGAEPEAASAPDLTRLETAKAYLAIQEAA